MGDCKEAPAEVVAFARATLIEDVNRVVTYHHPGWYVVLGMHAQGVQAEFYADTGDADALAALVEGGDASAVTLLAKPCGCVGLSQHNDTVGDSHVEALVEQLTPILYGYQLLLERPLMGSALANHPRAKDEQRLRLAGLPDAVKQAIRNVESMEPVGLLSFAGARGRRRPGRGRGSN